MTALEMPGTADPDPGLRPLPDVEDILDYLMALAGEMNLRQWVLRVTDAWLDEHGEAWARIDAEDHKHKATIRCARGLLTHELPDTIRYVFVHELVHLHLEEIHRTLRNSIELDVGTIVWNIVNGSVRHQMELSVDAIARAWAPSLPYPAWADPAVESWAAANPAPEVRPQFTLTATTIDADNVSTSTVTPENITTAPVRSVLLNGRHVFYSAPETDWTYERVCQLAGLDPTRNPTVTWRERPSNRSGSLVAGGLVSLAPGLVITAVHTTDA